MRRLAIYHFETLLWIDRLGTFRAAARAVEHDAAGDFGAGCAKSRDQLGVALFRREGRLMVLTTRGRDLVRDIEPLWAGFERVLTRASNSAEISGVVVRIGAGEIAAFWMFARLCPRSRARSAWCDAGGGTRPDRARMLQQLLAGGVPILAFLAGAGRYSRRPHGADRRGRAGVCGQRRDGARAGSGCDPDLGAAAGFPAQCGDARMPGLSAQLSTRAIATCDNMRTLIDIVLAGGGGGGHARNDGPALCSRRALWSKSRRVRCASLQFEAAIRETERDPLVLELFRRAALLQIDP